VPDSTRSRCHVRSTSGSRPGDPRPVLLGSKNSRPRATANERDQSCDRPRQLGSHPRYYTQDTTAVGKTIGMLSVDGATGAIW
jgi:hypothetical protein